MRLAERPLAEPDTGWEPIQQWVYSRNEFKNMAEAAQAVLAMIRSCEKI
jgi:hypothetical protein